YCVPPKQQQPGSGTAPTTDVPQGYCINDTSTLLFNGQTGCWRLLFGGEPAHNEVISRPDSNDTRMQQVTYANGKLWGALDTALNPDSGPQRAGIAWYIVKPDTGVALQGYLAPSGCTAGRLPPTGRRSGSPASTSPTPASTPPAAARSSRAARATTSSVHAVARATARAPAPRAPTGRRGSASSRRNGANKMRH